MMKSVCGIVCACVLMATAVAGDELTHKSPNVMAVQRRLTQIERRVSALAGEVHKERDPLVDAMESYDPDYVCILDRIKRIEERLIRLERLQRMAIRKGADHE